MAAPVKPISANSLSVGHSTKLVQIISISPDGTTAICADRSGYEARVPMLSHRAKGLLPQVGENWIISKDIAQQDGWNFAQFIGGGPSSFQVGPSDIQPGAVGASALAPGVLNGLPLSGNQIIFPGSGYLLGYSGAPAPGNLEWSIAPVAGTDGSSNPYPEGIQTDHLNISKGPGTTGPQGMNIPGALLATFPGIVANTTTLKDVATYTIPANEAKVGSVWELEVWGEGSQGSTHQQLIMQVAIGGTPTSGGLVTFGTTAFTGGAFRWRAAVRAICRATPGTGAKWTSYINAITTDSGSAVSPGNGNEATGFSCEGGSTPGFDSTIPQVLSLQCAWGGTTSGPSVTSRVALPKRLA